MRNLMAFVLIIGATYWGYTRWTGSSDPATPYTAISMPQSLPVKSLTAYPGTH
jgi:hypothetical protein